MTLTIFLTQLSKDGMALVDNDPVLSPDDDWTEIISAWDAIQREELAFTAPPLSLSAAHWAAQRLYYDCQSLICRDISSAELNRHPPYTETHTPSVIYSVDLLFRFLPALVTFARRLAQNDPLVNELLTLAHTWPLSSVGIQGVAPIDPSQTVEIVSHPSLRQLYVDRILATNDTARLSDPILRQSALSSLGAYPELAPACYSYLKLDSHEPAI